MLCEHKPELTLRAGGTVPLDTSDFMRNDSVVCPIQIPKVGNYTRLIHSRSRPSSISSPSIIPLRYTCPMYLCL